MKTLFTFLFFTSFLFANLDLSKEEKDFIQNNPTVIIGLTNDKPFTFKENDEIGGLTKDILNEISKLTNLQFDIKQSSWIKNFEDFKNNKIDIISDLFYKKERAAFTLYSKPYVVLPLIIFANKEYPGFRSFNDFESVKVGVIKDSSVIKSLQNSPNIQIVEFNSQNEQISALSFGNIDFALQTLQTANVYIRKNFYTNIYPINNYDAEKYYEQLHFGITKKKPLLHSIINKALNNIDLDQIERKWFELKINKDKIALSKKEKEFLKNHPIITLGTEKSWEPYVIKSSDGTIRGYDVDILKKINQLTGANFQLKLGNWSQMQELAKSKKIDGLSTGAIHDERKTYLNFSDVYISLQKMLIVKHRNPLNIQSKEDLEGKTIVIHKGNLVDEKIAKEFPKSNIIKTDTVEQMLKEVIYGKADATFGNGATEYLANKLGLPYLDFAFALEHRLELAFGVRKDWPEAISIINKALASIPEYEKLRIKEKWFVLSEYEKKYKPKENKVILSVDEKIYIQKNPSVKLCIDPHWYPFEFLNKEGKHDGLIAELLARISSNIGLSTELVKTDTWSESLQYLQNKKCEIVASAQKTNQREKYLNFTSAYVSTPLVLVTKSSVNFIDDFQKVSNKSFAIVKGYASIDLLREKYKNISIIEVDSIDTGLQYILNEKVFGFIDTVPTTLHAIKQNGYTNLSINGKVDINWNLRIGTVKEKPILNSIFEKGVKSFSEKEKEEIYNNWINIPNIKEPDYTLFWQILAILVLIILGAFFWNRKLNQKIEEGIEKHKLQENLLFYYAKQKSIGETVGNISHQWRHPLSELSGNIMHLETKRKLDKEISKEELDTNLQNSKKLIQFMSDTVESFYSFYKNDKKIENFYGHEAIEEVLHLLKGALQTSNITVNTNLDKNITYSGNINEFKQVIFSIILNSKKAFEIREIKNRSIDIELFERENQKILQISDNAGGIDDEILKNLFTSPVSNMKGSGIGLYLAQSIIQKSFSGKIVASNSTNGAILKMIV